MSETRKETQELQNIFNVIQEYHMIEPGMRVIAGVSGGADSVCLLYILQEYRKSVPFELMAVHVEHGLRGEESLEDAQFTRLLCAGFEVPCRIVPAAVRQLAERKGLSLEEAGRLERYRIFGEVRREWKADRIALAHNQNDQAETVLWNLARGSGLKGLGGIRPVRDEKIRPLLFTPRTEIEALLRSAGLSWRTDRTNLETDYTRNRIRLSLLPQMERELNTRATEHIAQAAGRLQELQELLERMTAQAAERCIRTDGELSLFLPAFHQEEKLIRQELLRECLSRCGGLRDVGASHIEMLEALSDMPCGKECHLPGGVRAVRERDRIRFTRVHPARCSAEQKAFYEFPVPGILHLPHLTVDAELYRNSPAIWSQIQEEKKYTKWLSYDTIKSNLCLRRRQPGDYLIVNDRGGRKKLKDYLIDNKVPREERDGIWLLADGSHILWMIGYRISEAAKVSPRTECVMKIHVKEEKHERES